MLCYWRGRPLESLSRDELIEALTILGTANNSLLAGLNDDAALRRELHRHAELYRPAAEEAFKARLEKEGRA